MQKRCFALSLVLGLVACGGETPTASDYGEIVRTGYFEGDASSGDWRAEYISGEDARKDLSVLDFSSGPPLCLQRCGRAGRDCGSRGDLRRTS